MNIRDFKTVGERRNFIESERNVTLTSIGSFSLDEQYASTHNCENMIGALQIPIGIAGPINIDGEFAKGDFFVPLATTEGALVASISRGCKILSENGGVTTTIKHIGITRAPVFEVENASKGQELIKWIENNFEKIKETTDATSNHLHLLKTESIQDENLVHVKFYFDTEEAMGMNMATIATAATSKLIEESTKAKLIALSGNFCSDKKVSAVNFSSGRGYSVTAEAQISKESISEILKTTPEKIMKVYEAKILSGSKLAKTIGANAQIANVVAAIFLATGQDAGHIGESSLGTTTLSLENDSLKASVFLPDILVGTVGGGTTLSTQKEVLSILGLNLKQDGSNTRALSEIIASAVLAGEISLLAALSTNTLASAHQKLARGGTN